MANDAKENIKTGIENFFEAEFGIGFRSRTWQLKRGVPPWDSIRHIELITSFEKSFGVALNVQEVQSIQSAEDFLNYLLRHS